MEKVVVNDYASLVNWAYSLYCERGFDLAPLEKFDDVAKRVLVFEMVGRKKSEVVIKELFKTFGTVVNVGYTSTSEKFDLKVAVAKNNAIRAEAKNRMEDYTLEVLKKDDAFIEPHKVANTDIYITFTYDNWGLIWPISKLRKTDKNGETRRYSIPKTEMDPNSGRQATVRYFFSVDDAIIMKVPNSEEWDRINEILRKEKERVEAERRLAESSKESKIRDEFLKLEEEFVIKV